MPRRKASVSRAALKWNKCSRVLVAPRGIAGCRSIVSCAAARTADFVFAVVNGDEIAARELYNGLNARVVEHGREPEHLKNLAKRYVGRRPHSRECTRPIRPFAKLVVASNASELVSRRIEHDI